MIGTILVAGASVTASLFVMQVAVLPLVFRYSKSVQRKMIFSNFINYPRNLDYENPSNYIVGARNFSIDFHSKVDARPIKLGVWHIVPCSTFRELFIVRESLNLDERLLKELKSTRNPVVLYCHGNSNHRASPPRLQMYKVFQELNFHVITFDYRGYGDSTNVRPTEMGVVEDALHVYSWLLNTIDQESKPMILIWGHSLGSAVSAHLVAHMSSLCADIDKPPFPPPDALIMEAPFNNLMDEIENHPFSKLVSWLPYYRATFVEPFVDSTEYSFKTDQYLTKVPHIPILILHSKGDKVVPYDLSVKLYGTIQQSRQDVKSSSPIILHPFERGQGLGHNNLCDSPDLPDIIRDFLQTIKNRGE